MSANITKHCITHVLVIGHGFLIALQIKQLAIYAFM